MVYDSVVVIGFKIMIESLVAELDPGFAELLNKISAACVYELHPAELSDVGFDPCRIHPADASVDLHHLGDRPGEIFDAVMVEIDSMKSFIVVAANAEA